MTTPDRAFYHPGAPPIFWAKSLTNPTEIPWRPGFAAWHRRQKVWIRLVAEHPYGETHPDDAILFTPEFLEDGTATSIAARVDELEQMILRLTRGR